MIRVVIDTNVILSALYFPGGNPWRVVMCAMEGIIQNITSEFILEEVRCVLNRKFLWRSTEIERAIAMIKFFSETAHHEKHLDVIPCGPDNRILECTLAGEVDFIISGDRHLTNIKEFQGITIVNPATFLSIIQYEEPNE